MRLLSLLSLAAAAIAIAVPAPQIDSKAPVSINVPAESPAIADTLSAGPFFVYTLEITEYCKSGNMAVKGFLKHKFGTAWEIPFDLPGHQVPFPFEVNGVKFSVQYDYVNHWTKFDHDLHGEHCSWGQDMYPGAQCGHCNCGVWSRPVLDCEQNVQPERKLLMHQCWINMGYRLSDRKSVAAQGATSEALHDESKGFAARELTPDSNGTQSTATVTQSLDTLNTAVPTSEDVAIGVRVFSASVTEYCEASEGTPRKARGTWSTGDWWEQLDFEDGHKAYSYSLGYPGLYLEVGPYDYYKSQLWFKYGDCRWNQDHRYKACGSCVSKPWSDPTPLNCAVNPSATRNHGIECQVVVDQTQVAQIDTKLIAARKADPADAFVLKASTTTTEVIDVIQTVTPAASDAVVTILPFHFTVTEYCDNGNKQVKGHYSNGNINKDFDLPPRSTVDFNHKIPGFPLLNIGPYDYSASRMEYQYTNGPQFKCKWYDNETGRECGECRAGQWSGDLNCAGGGGYRVKEMDCSFILGTHTKA